MKVAVVGSRGFGDLEMVRAYVRSLPVGTVVVSGGARGVDSVAVAEAERIGLETIVFIPNWKKHGKRGGIIRNTLIVESADMLVAFWDGQSAGTGSSILLAQEKGIPTDVYKAKEKGAS